MTLNLKMSDLLFFSQHLGLHIRIQHTLCGG